MRILMITPLDYHQANNNREHNMLRHFSEMGCDITMLCKAMNRSPKFLDLLWDTCTFRIIRTIETIGNSNAVFLKVDPFFNYFAGLRTYSDSKRLQTGNSLTLKDLLVRIFSCAAFIRDILSVMCMLYAGMLKPQGHFEVCIGFGPWGTLTGWFLKKIGKVDILVYEDRDYEPGLVPDRLRQLYTAWIERKLLTSADIIVSIGYRLAELRAAQSQKKVHIIPTGVEWDMFHEARTALKTERTLIYVGNLISWSGLDLTISAMPAVLTVFPDTKLIIAGDGLASYVTYLKELVARLGIADNVEFLGIRPYRELPGILGRAMIGLANAKPVDYRKFAYPLKVIEYMAAGLPVIGTEGTETADIIAQYNCGISVAFEPVHLADAVIALFADKAFYNKLRENCISESSLMTWKKLMERELELIKKSVSG